MMVTYADELAFQADDRRRGVSDEVDLGATWRAAGSRTAWRLAWLRETGELYRCRTGGYPGPSSEVSVLAVVPDERALDALLDGWREHRDHPDGLAWLADRVAQATDG